MFNVSSNYPGLKFGSQKNLFLFFLFLPRCLITVEVEERLRARRTLGLSQHSPSYTLILQYVSCTTLSQAVQKVFALSFFWMYEVYYLGDYARNCTK